MKDQIYKIKKEHFQNLIAIANADGMLDEEEKDLLYEKAHEFGINESHVDYMIDNADTLEFIIPKKVNSKEEYLTEIIYMALIDGELHDKEYAICLKISERLGLKKDDLDNGLSLIKKLWE